MKDALKTAAIASLALCAVGFIYAIILLISIK
jgi:hypothetical protein